jgi:transposase-like protein
VLLHTAYSPAEEFAASVTDMYVNGVSAKKLKDALKAMNGEKIRLSTVSRITKRLREEFKAWQRCSKTGGNVIFDAFHA